jgi:hypothetical protein
MYRRTILMAVEAITALALPAGTAYAATGNSSSDPTAAQYGGSAADSAAGLHDKVGQLPFTGWDVVALLVVSAAMLVTGMALRKLSRPTSV